MIKAVMIRKCTPLMTSLGVILSLCLEWGFKGLGDRQRDNTDNMLIISFNGSLSLHGRGEEIFLHLTASLFNWLPIEGDT